MSAQLEAQREQDESDRFDQMIDDLTLEPRHYGSLAHLLGENLTQYNFLKLAGQHWHDPAEMGMQIKMMIRETYGDMR